MVSLGGGVIPNVAAEVFLVACAIELVLVAKSIDFWRAVPGAHMDTTKRGLQWLQQVVAQLLSGPDGALRVFRNVAHAMPGCDLTLQEFAHEEIGREACAAEFFELGVGCDG